MATAGFDRKLCLRDVRDSKIELTREMKADVEFILWHPHDPHLLSVAAEDGTVETHDARCFSSAPLCSFKAHDKAVSAISFSPAIKNMAVTVSPDQKVKVWDYSQINEGRPKMIIEKNPGMGELFCCNFFRDSPWFIATGGSKGELFVWDLEESADIVAVFGGRVEKGTEPMEVAADTELKLPQEADGEKKVKAKGKHKHGKKKEGDKEKPVTKESE